MDDQQFRPAHAALRCTLSMSPYQRTLQMYCPFISSKYCAKCCFSKTQGDVEHAHNHVSSRIGGIDDGFQASNSFGTRKSMRLKVSLEGFQSWRGKSLPFDPRQCSRVGK